MSKTSVNLREPGLTTLTDLTGRYLFRDLAAGSYTISVQHEAQTSTRAVRLGAQPVDLTNVDFQISGTGASDVLAPEAIRVKP